MSRKKKNQVSKGTGKRYTSSKPKPQTTPVRRTAPPASYAEKTLRKRISQFGLSQRFEDDFERAFEQYMGPEAIRRQGDRKILLIEDVETELPGFQEWFYFDHILESGDRIIDLFTKEEGEKLSGVQWKILEDWLATNRLRLLETQAVEPGIGETMQDLLSGEIFHLDDISFSYHGIRWSVFLGRPLLTEGRWHFTGSGTMLNPLEKPRILKAAKELWVAYQEKYPQSELSDFYRDHSLDLRHIEREILDERSKPKALLSREGHPAVSARAEFILNNDPLEVEDLLDEAEEFEFVGEQEEGEFSGCLHYIWLLRGSSSMPEAPEDLPPSGGLILSGSWTAGPGEPDYYTLGDLYLSEEELTLVCISRERLEAGKHLLNHFLGTRINHQHDQYSDLRELNDEPDMEDQDVGFHEEDWEDEDEIAAIETIREEMAERLTMRWLDTPDANGVTPRQAAQTSEGREKLQENLKVLDFFGDQALKSGKMPPMRLDLIRRVLGL
ncbi:MAG: hypothetical protein A2Z16_11705 [Chloroflexi bacterium RBG_16_54_18]|nr:MAG: hypothetical protein A2Z16_11705 [Chloroflexi bacterium RBG_16_54_18]